MFYLVVIFLLCSKQVTSNEPSIIIVGAGASGIAAATKLLENGFTNIKILEAEPRIGGRVHSIKNGETFVDLGAEFCRGQENNIVYETVKHLNLLGNSDQYNEYFLYSKEEVDQEFGRELANLTDKIYEESIQQKGSTETVGDFCLNRYTESIHETYGNDKYKLSVAQNTVDYFEHLVMFSEGSYSWYHLQAGSDFELSKGDFSLNWKDKGFRTLFDVITKNLPIDNKIHLNKEVVQIDWDRNKNENSVVIKCNDNSVYLADHVIFTPSLGVLKANADHLFKPSLPDIKRRSISQIGFGTVVKAIVFFPKKWWYHMSTLVVWSDEDIKKASEEFPEGPKFRGRSWITHLFYLTTNRHIPNTVTVCFSGPLARETEKIPEELFKKGVYYVLNKFMGYTPQDGKIEKIISSDFYSNPHFRGSFSYQSINTTLKYTGKSSEEELAEPILNNKGIPIIQFAGEATSPNHYGTVHGAVETGYREANLLINLFKN